MPSLFRKILTASLVSLVSLVGLLCSNANAIAVGDVVPIKNADFERGNGATNPHGTIEDWSLIRPGGEVWIGDTGPKGTGHQVWIMYLDGWDPRFSASGIYQDISNLTVGADYELTFYTGATHTPLPPGGSAHWKVSFGDSSVDGSGVQSNGGAPVWKKDVVSFIATDTTQRLSFEAVFIGAIPGVSPEILTLGGLSMQVTAVPEPSSAAMGLVGLTVLGFMARRRRKPD